MSNNTFIFDELKCLLESNRSIRRFDNTYKIETCTLKRLIDLTRFCASGRNLQPLRYRIVNDEKECGRVYETLSWAGYYTDWAGPSQEEQPTAYLIQCLDTNLTKNLLCDDGLQLEAITLGATALGLNTCIIKAFKSAELREILTLPSHLDPIYVVAIGKAAEKARIVNLGKEGDYKYFRDKEDVQNVPKRSLDDLIIE